ncbi:MAG: EF-P lysine aminoacylase EpmA [Gammaproteobacteria bacterium]|nr:EF-P lysine aminoacylase EpmA [Gammaproteobacteria bacterium]
MTPPHGAAWRPSATFEVLRRRAVFINKIRTFFHTRGVLEVETPILSRAATTDVHLDSFETTFGGAVVAKERLLYLHTSPEFFMKRLLAAGSGPIYQICKVFRNGEVGKVHNPEFTLLEWYRPGYNDRDLMLEMDELLHEVLGFSPAIRLSYAEAFEQILHVDPHTDPLEKIKSCVEKNALSLISNNTEEDRDFWLDLLFSHAVQPRLGHGQPVFLYDFPASQAALARKRAGPPPVAERFELFYNGVELANGFHELCNADEQRARFDADVAKRRQLGLPITAQDMRFIAALDAGLPASAGVAVGLDRLFMVSEGIPSLAEVLSFDFSIV